MFFIFINLYNYIILQRNHTIFFVCPLRYTHTRERTTEIWLLLLEYASAARVIESYNTFARHLITKRILKTKKKTRFRIPTLIRILVSTENSWTLFRHIYTKINLLVYLHSAHVTSNTCNGTDHAIKLLIKKSTAVTKITKIRLTYINFVVHCTTPVGYGKFGHYKNLVRKN